MPNAPRPLIALAAVAALAGCHKSAPQQNAAANQVALDNEEGPPPDIEALPPDESSATPSNQLVNGDDSPDVNDTTANGAD
ncbi:hypothetical protein [Sphingomonas sp.]|uniref:hypothetical protein n=1 Tax=Sphingomonas sp. TaxID=28214 RepID=UPI0025E634D3|nr:hypothetical protein [Sphingomonas sp.]MBV9529473.1 hypothetical protein [Sphingomonas sp.]